MTAAAPPSMSPCPSSERKAHSPLVRPSTLESITRIPASHGALAGLPQSILELLGNHIFNAVAGLFRTGLDVFSGVFGHDLSTVANGFGPRLRAVADFFVACLTT